MKNICLGDCFHSKKACNSKKNGSAQKQLRAIIEANIECVNINKGK
jgi:hypothetical protein